MKTRLSCLVVGLTSALVLAGDGDVARDEPVKFKITSKRNDDRVQVRVDKGKVLFNIKSPFGISQAVIDRDGEKWPAVVQVRLHLKGLESFRASNGKIRLASALSLEDGKAKTRQWKDDKEDAPLDEKSPLWIDFRVLGGDGKPVKKLPLENGYFEITLPGEFFKGSPRSITLSWIDFHRV